MKPVMSENLINADIVRLVQSTSLWCGLRLITISNTRQMMNVITFFYQLLVKSTRSSALRPGCLWGNHTKHQCVVWDHIKQIQSNELAKVMYGFVSTDKES